mgnify:FL=1
MFIIYFADKVSTISSIFLNFIVSFNKGGICDRSMVDFLYYLSDNRTHNC